MLGKSEIKINRIKVPYSGKNKNRKGSLKKSVAANRVRPVDDMNLFDRSLTVRFGTDELRDRVYFILNLNDGICQVCDTNRDLDYPHHAMQGAKKTDTRMINICLHCHDVLHRVGFETLKKTREELEEIGWNNHLEYMESV
ncbi:MAG: hypothetical protein PF437_03375 [Sulfurimonas sp.]|jgi:myosin-crossreactive antigen|nr:hypothetical protein [Sulfurimonas sp.]